MLLPGVLISFEGIDGAGKSTHIDALGERFRRHGRTVTVTREPGGTPLAEKLREMLLHDSMDVLTEALLVFAARRDHIEKVIEPALKRGEVVLCDRFTDSSFAYQGGGQGLDLSVLAALEEWVQGGRGPDRATTRHPDLTLWFDMPPTVAAERLSGARTPDRFEARGVEFFARVANGYALRAEQFPDRFFRLAANRARDAVWSDVERAVMARGWLA